MIYPKLLILSIILAFVFAWLFPNDSEEETEFQKTFMGKIVRLIFITIGIYVAIWFLSGILMNFM